jgi:hypothetical protein
MALLFRVHCDGLRCAWPILEFCKGGPVIAALAVVTVVTAVTLAGSIQM